MRLYYYTHFEHGLDDILNHHIKVSTLDSVNDPYEWGPSLKKVPFDYARDFFHKRYGHQVGFVCLCEEPDNPVMWALYGEKHRGMVLGFDCDTDLFKPVVYSKEGVCWDGLEDLDEVRQNELFNSFIYHKYEEWAYEKEYRLYVDLARESTKECKADKAMYFLNIDNGLMRLEEIILGCHAHDRDDEVKDVLNRGRWICTDTPALRLAKLSSKK